MKNFDATCAIETALLDAQSRRLGIPLSELLGGRLRNELPVAWTLASGDLAKDIAEAEKMLASRRHRIFKLKIGLRSVEDDVKHVLAIKRALGALIWWTPVGTSMSCCATTLHSAVPAR